MKKIMILAAFLIVAGSVQASACEWMRQAAQEPVTMADESSSSATTTTNATTNQQPTAREETAVPVSVASK